MTQQELSSASGVSVATIRAIEAGRSGELTTRTIRGLEAAFGWTPGSFADIYTGHTPTVLTTEPVTTSGLSDAEALNQLRDSLAAMSEMLERRTREIEQGNLVSNYINEDVWDLAKTIAGKERRSINAIINDALYLYADVMKEPS